jgi:hypothetical protein
MKCATGEAWREGAVVYKRGEADGGSRPASCSPKRDVGRVRGSSQSIDEEGAAGAGEAGWGKCQCGQRRMHATGGK